jgi:hypothetical protein
MSDEQKYKEIKADSGQKLKSALAEASDLPEEEQKKLNQPLADPSGIDESNKVFLDDVVSKIESKEIDLHTPSTLINQELYEKLSEKIQGETDLNAVSLLAKLRDIKGLHDLGQIESYQFTNLVEQVRLTKERLEKDAGDIFII